MHMEPPVCGCMLYTRNVCAACMFPLLGQGHRHFHVAVILFLSFFFLLSGRVKKKNILLMSLLLL